LTLTRRRGVDAPTSKCFVESRIVLLMSEISDIGLGLDGEWWGMILTAQRKVALHIPTLLAVIRVAAGSRIIWINVRRSWFFAQLS
jgi:hypothetical protein